MVIFAICLHIELDCEWVKIKRSIEMKAKKEPGTKRKKLKEI